MPVVVIQAFGVLIFVIGSMWLASEIRRSGSRGVAIAVAQIMAQVANHLAIR